jgi:hypothetical protein
VKIEKETATYAQMGMAALLPGMQYMLEQMEALAAEMRANLTALQQGPRRGRPKKLPIGKMDHADRARSGWSDDPEERRTEMARRLAVRKKNKAMHPRDPNHPKHAEWAAKVSKAQKKRWGKLTVAERKAQLARMTAGKTEEAA